MKYAAVKPKLYIFDLDGVLVNSYDCWWNLLNEGLRIQGKPPLTAQEFDAGWGQGIDADQQMFFPDWTIGQVQEFYEARFPEFAKWVKEEEGAKELVTTLKSNGYLTGVASNSPSGVVRHLLEHIGILPIIDSIASVDQVANGKPEPDLIIKVLNDLNCKPEDAWYVGDSQFDADAASKAGVYFIGYKRSGDKRIESLHELAKIH